MKEELSDFLRFCAVERRLAPLTCSAYERDVSACLGYLQVQGFEDLSEVRPTHLQRVTAHDCEERSSACAGSVDPERSRSFCVSR